ncbi:MAG: glycosyl transferase [Acidimicrobiaceae bacterium]|nr:glycosyl transferase [Acidimicrobiaceae bacterium]
MEESREHRRAASLSVALAATTIWSYELTGRSSTWMPELRVVLLPVGLAASFALLVAPLRRHLGMVLAGTALLVGLAGPAAYTLQTVSTVHGGAIPSAGPAQSGASGFGGPGGGAGGGPGGPGGRAGGSIPRNGAAGAPRGAAPGGTAGNGGGFGPAGGGGAVGFGGRGAAGGLLNSSTPSAALTKLLESDASRYTWVAAVVGSNSASGYQLATDDPVMAIGGFNGSDPAPSLAQFEADVAAGKIHYFIADGGAGAGGGGTSSVAGAITSWVEAHYTATTVGGVTLYLLSK